MLPFCVLQNFSSASNHICFLQTKQEMAGDDRTIELCITFHQDGISTYVRFNRDRMIKCLLVAYCDKKQLEYGQISFLYGGKRLLVRKTPNQIGMKDGDEIEAFMNVHGGLG